MNTPETEDPSFHSKEEPPLKNVQVLVVSQMFRCLGYLDDEGIWRDAFHREELKNVIGWLPFD